MIKIKWSKMDEKTWRGVDMSKPFGYYEIVRKRPSLFVVYHTTAVFTDKCLGEKRTLRKAKDLVEY